MKRIAILSISAIFLVGLVFLGSLLLTTAKKPTSSIYDEQQVSNDKPATVDELLTLVNAERAKVGVAPLVIDERLNRSAQQKDDDMVTNDYLGHIDKNGRHGYDIAHEFAPDICPSPSENLAWGEDRAHITAGIAVDWWMSSKPHHDAMLNPVYKYTGFGIRDYVITEHFC